MEVGWVGVGFDFVDIYIFYSVIRIRLVFLGLGY